MNVRPQRLAHTIAPRLGALLLVLALAIGLSACSFFATPSAPPPVARAANSLKTMLERTPGISGVRVRSVLRDVEGDDQNKPSAWLITAYATSQSSTADLYPIALAIENGLDTSRRVAPTEGELQLAGDGHPNAVLDFDRRTSPVALRGFVNVAKLLQTLTGIERAQISLDGQAPNVTVRSADHWLGTAQQLRSLSGFGTGLLSEVTVYGPGRFTARGLAGSITVDASTPNTATLTGLLAVARQTGVTSVSYDAVRPSHSMDDWRPALSVDTKTRAARQVVLRLLTGFDRQSAPVPGIPRASFRVYGTNDRTYQETDGYLGLPLGSAEPADLVPAPTTPLDPAVEAARLEKNLRLVHSALDTAGDTAGIRGAPSVTAMPCDVGPGTQVTGNVLIPIFQITDRADAAYAAIVATWKSRGYTKVEFAGPTELRWGGSLRLLTIDGTPDGIRITADSRCE